MNLIEKTKRELNLKYSGPYTAEKLCANITISENMRSLNAWLGTVKKARLNPPPREEKTETCFILVIFGCHNGNNDKKYNLQTGLCNRP